MSCIALAVALALVTGDWTTALAIALAGAALALALRPAPAPVIYDDEDGDATDLAMLRKLDDITARQDTQAAEISTLRTTLTEIADIVEGLADADAAPRATAGEFDAGNAAATDELRARLDLLESRLDGAQRAGTIANDAASQLAPVRARPEQVEEVEDTAHAAQDAQSAERQTGTGGPSAIARLQRLRSTATNRLASVLPDGRPTTAAVDEVSSRPGAPESDADAYSTPVFAAGRNDPATYIVDAARARTGERQARRIFRAALDLLSAPSRIASDAPVFLKLDPALFESEHFMVVASDLLDDAKENARRLSLLLPQQMVRSGLPGGVSVLLEHGATFALCEMVDWSADLKSLAAAGLTHIVVDGPVMARTAIEQKGDPTRLKAVLAARGIELVAAGLDSRMQQDAVATLEAPYLTGRALGEPQPFANGEPAPA